MNWYHICKSLKEGYILTEIPQQRVLAGTEFQTSNLLTQIFFDLQPYLPYSTWIVEPVHVALAQKQLLILTSTWMGFFQTPYDVIVSFDIYLKKRHLLNWRIKVILHRRPNPENHLSHQTMQKVNMDYLISWAEPSFFSNLDAIWKLFGLRLANDRIRSFSKLS